MHTHGRGRSSSPAELPPPQNVCHDWLMQQRARREALTPEKMKRDEWLLGNSRLSLEEKKRKIVKSVSRLEASGLLQAPDSHQQILHMIAKVTNRRQTGRGPGSAPPSSSPLLLQDISQRRRRRWRRRAELQRLARTLARLQAKSCFHSQQVDYYSHYITSCLDNLAATRWACTAGGRGEAGVTVDP